VQVGPDAIALATQLTKGLGLSHAKAAAVLRDGYGLTVSRSGLCRAIQRLGTKAAPTYDALVQATQTSLLIWIDETGWRVAGRLQWLWVAVSEQATVFKIQPGRGFFDEAATLLGADYEGFLHHDGWRSYYTFPRAFHQSCVAHIVRRCEELITCGSRAAAWFPQAVLDLVQRGLALRDRGEAGTITPHGLAVATGRLDATLGRLLARPVRTPEHRRLAKHLRHERPHLFTFLHCPGVHATNNVAYAASRIMPGRRRVRCEHRGISGSVRLQCRHNHRLWRKANRLSDGWNRDGVAPEGSAWPRARSFSRMSAWR
jgi:transposase